MRKNDREYMEQRRADRVRYTADVANDLDSATYSIREVTEALLRGHAAADGITLRPLNTAVAALRAAHKAQRVALAAKAAKVARGEPTHPRRGRGG